jgi:hypothetical protein
MSYLPNPNSVAARTIEFLRKHGPATPREISTALLVGSASLSTLLGPSLRAGLIWREGKSNRVCYSLPPPQPKGDAGIPASNPIDTPADDPPTFSASLWTDGELLIDTADGQLRFTADQVDQLRRLLTGQPPA